MLPFKVAYESHMFATFSGPKKVSLSSSSVQVQEAVTRAVALDLARPVKATDILWSSWEERRGSGLLWLLWLGRYRRYRRYSQKKKWYNDI